MKKLSFLIIVFLFNATTANAQFSLIRDAETEKFLRELSSPVFDAAGLGKDIKIYIVNDDSINAFVSAGQNVFINTGLIRKYTTPDTLIGVIAHEAGHIVGGHLARAGEGMQDAENAMLLSYLLGIGALLGGSPEAGQALILGGSQTAQRLYAKFTRTQEEAADQYAIEFLKQMSYPADGLINLLEFFDHEMTGYKGKIDEYLLSHPVSKKRIDLLKERMAGTRFSDQKVNRGLQKQMSRVLVKLEAFMENPEEVLKKYHNRGDEMANYAKAIAFFRKGVIDTSLLLLDKVILQNSGDGFLQELRGQILFESGMVEEASVAYNKAIKLLNGPDAVLSRIAFASSILALKKDDRDLIELAIMQLEIAKNIEEKNPLVFKQLALSYSKISDEARSLLALAEFNLLTGNKEKCQKFAKRAKDKLGSEAKEELLRADDLVELCKADI